MWYRVYTVEFIHYHWSPVYTIQPVVKRVIKPVGQPGKCLYTRYNRLSNWFDNRLYRVHKHSTGCQTHLTTSLTNGCIMYIAGCQTGCTTRLDNQLNEQWLFVQHSCETGRQTGLTTGWMFVYTIQPLSNRLYLVNGVWVACGYW